MTATDKEVAEMTLPGKMLTESVDRLAQSIAASKAVSDELRAASVAAPATPVPVQEVEHGQGGGAGQEAAR